MALKKYKILLSAAFVLVTGMCHGQPKTSKWTNKESGTYYIDLGIRGIRDSTRCSVFIRVFELTDNGCNSLTDKIKFSINGKMYSKIDTLDFEDGRGPDYSFSDDFATGDYNITVYSSTNDYYPVKTGKLNLLGNGNYSFTFYLIRKKKIKH